MFSINSRHFPRGNAELISNMAVLVMLGVVVLSGVVITDVFFVSTLLLFSVKSSVLMFFIVPWNITGLSTLLLPAFLSVNPKI